MRRLILVAALSAVVLAKPKPEMYKEKEDFQYSRSSSDDGSKAGFYGAQRGNMGGNYERAHNMDLLAQHQMGGLVKQVDGELGDGAKTRTGSVYTSANSRGIYGSGHYDLSNLKGRNFAEGQTDEDIQSHLSLTSQNSGYKDHSYNGLESAGYSSGHAQNSRYSGYQTLGHVDQTQIDNLQAVDTSQGLGRYENNNQATYNLKYNTQRGSRGQNEFDQNSALHTSSGIGTESQTRYITTPVKVVLRPGGRVAIPITGPTYGVFQSPLSEDKNAINSDAEVINQHVGLKPTNKDKHYEASYSYRKEWEKHHEIPGDVLTVAPTESPFPKNSELYEDAQLLQSAHSSQRASTKSAASSGARIQPGFDAQQSQFGLNSQQSQLGLNTQQSHLGFNSQHSRSGSAAQQSQLGFNSQHNQLGYNTQQSQLGYNAQQSSAASEAYENAIKRGAHSSGISSDLTNTVENIDTKPKSYQSSYSYHKSWERQGDPYVIQPVGGVFSDQSAQKLMAASANSAAYSSHQYGSHSRQAQRYSADCDDEGHARVPRSYDTDQTLEQQQNKWEDLGQQSQNLEDLGQQTEAKLDNLQDLGQQQQSKWDNLQELGQQTQNQWDNLQQVGQDTQNQWDNLQQLGQQTQNQWDNLQQLGQQTQDKFENLEDLGQHTQSKWQ